MRKIGWSLMLVLAALVSLYAAAVILLPGFGPPFISEHRSIMPIAVVTHLAGGLIALSIGPWQLNARVRDANIRRHRLLGRTYMVCVLLSALAALAMAPFAQTGRVAAVGFGALALAWLATTILAFTRIRAGRVEQHRRWMIRGYSLTLAAVTLRIYLPLSLVAGVPFTVAYPAIAWLCWVPNLVVAELWIMRQHPVAAPAPA